MVQSQHSNLRENKPIEKKLSQSKTQNKQGKHEILLLYAELIGQVMPRCEAQRAWQPCTQSLMVAASMIFLLDRPRLLLTVFLSRCPFTLLSPSTSWSLHRGILPGLGGLPLKSGGHLHESTALAISMPEKISVMYRMPKSVSNSRGNWSPLDHGFSHL